MFWKEARFVDLNYHYHLGSLRIRYTPSILFFKHCSSIRGICFGVARINAFNITGGVSGYFWLASRPVGCVHCLHLDETYDYLPKPGFARSGAG